MYWSASSFTVRILSRQIIVQSKWKTEYEGIKGLNIWENSKYDEYVTLLKPLASLCAACGLNGICKAGITKWFPRTLRFSLLLSLSFSLPLPPPPSLSLSLFFLYLPMSICLSLFHGIYGAHATDRDDLKQQGHRGMATVCMCESAVSVVNVKKKSNSKPRTSLHQSLG